MYLYICVMISINNGNLEASVNRSTLIYSRNICRFEKIAQPESWCIGQRKTITVHRVHRVWNGGDRLLLCQWRKCLCGSGNRDGQWLAPPDVQQWLRSPFPSLFYTPLAFHHRRQSHSRQTPPTTDSFESDPTSVRFSREN